jgi:hypothetical protein
MLYNAGHSRDNDLYLVNYNSKKFYIFMIAATQLPPGREPGANVIKLFSSPLK